MRKIKEVLRLKREKGLSNRQIGEICAISTTTVGEYLRRIEAAGLRCPLPADLSDTELERKLFPPQQSLPSGDRGTPDWNLIDKEMKRPGVTLELLWQEYRESHPDSATPQRTPFVIAGLLCGAVVDGLNARRGK